MIDWLIDRSIIVLFRYRRPFSTRNTAPGYNAISLRLVPVAYSLSACPHRQFQILPDLLDSRYALSIPTCVRAKQGGNLFHYYDGRGANPLPTAWEADTLSMKPTRRGFLNGKYTSLKVRFLLRNSLKITREDWLFQSLMFPRRLNLGHCIIVA